ncbi:molybdenum cofactor guanylyltransferase [Neomoorella mulderi]|uniref:Probable molybdenum cofactor guanylyltransferase n=1 Tax=Moorella mulderi DSM 14980 TaxID=1122241 RepID=A0A151AUK2_9FIRM|nr:molybdenum cofactor guanylyltransferase [Moorella mulderi]KYH31243.1 putative molybdenum cofactor guanylyltransferase [Moorella mulderi DSM 14980]
MYKAAGIVLAGGKSTRMGTNKALLPLGQESMLATVVTALRPLFPEIIVVTNTPELYRDLKARLVPDVIPGRGPLSGFHAGLLASPYWHNFIVACDMPFLAPDFIKYLLEQAPGYDVVVPRRGEYLQPLHAVYSRGCLRAIEDCLAGGNYQAFAFYPRVKVRYVDIDRLAGFSDPEKIFFNINTPADLARARRMLHEKDLLP